jgi:hypothetical protein
MNSDRSGSANEAFMARIMQGGDTTRIQATLTLADGTKCTDVYRCMTGGSSAQLLGASSKTFHATLEGTMKCGDAKDTTITFTALLKN